MKIMLIPLILIATILALNCSGSGDDTTTPDPAEELYGKTWQSDCTTVGAEPGKARLISMTFSSGGGFIREERNFSETTCSVGEADINIDKSFTWIEKTADPEIKKLRYIDENDLTVYALYKIDGTTLKFAESDSAYPADLSNAIDFY